MFALVLPWLNRFGCKSEAWGIYDWSETKIINVTDIPGHPMAEKMAEVIR